MKSKVYKRKVDTRDEMLAGILDAAACIKERNNKLRRTTSNLRTEVQSALWFTVEFSKVYCEPLQICHFGVTNLPFKHYTEIKIRLTVNNFYLFTTIHNVFVAVEPNISLSLSNHSE